MTTDADTALCSRIEELESRIAFQEDAIATLSDQLAWQANTIDVQKKQLLALNEKLQQLMFDIEQGLKSDVNIVDERPPHY